MTTIIFEHLADIVTGIFLIWGAALLWASWQIRAMVRSLAAERRELRRWARLHQLATRHNGKWQ